MYGHFQKHVLDRKDMSPFVDNPVDYVKRAHEMGAKLSSAGDFLVYEGTKIRRGVAVFERFVFNKSTSEVAIKILNGAEAGAMRTLHVRDRGLSDFMNMVAGMTQK